MKKYLFVSVVFIVVILGIINYRTPIFTKQKSGWSVGFDFFNSLKNVSQLNKNNIFSKEKLIKLEDSTVFLADPFFIKEKDTFYLFFEHQKKAKGAEIGLMSSIDGINYKYEGTVLKQNFHLSYPQVFKHKNAFYMLPESQKANNVLLYKAVNFPKQWKVVDTLLKNTKLKDPTIFLSDTLNILIGSDNEMNLYMYNSDSLQGKWKLNQTPVVLRGTESRCGGRIIVDKNDLLLPVQNCTKGYGYGLSIYRLSFKGHDYRVSKEQHLLLKANTTIREFYGGMHHLDFQKLENGSMYAVYDGQGLTEPSEYNFNIRGPLKWNFVDLRHYLESL